MKKYSNLLALIIGIIFCVAFLFIFEISLPDSKPLKHTQTFEAPNYWKKTLFEVVGATPGEHRFYRISENGQFVYDVKYSIDKAGRRITLPSSLTNRANFILFFGCSCTYGEAVQDHETLPYYVGQLSAHYMPYNYGFHGFGPFDVLAQIENIDFKKEVEEKKGIGIYVYLDFHTQRLLGSMSVMRWKKFGAYYYKDEKGVLIRRLDFERGRPLLTKIYRFLGQSKVIKYLNIDLPPRIQDTHIKLMVETIEQMKKGFQSQYPNSEFYVLIYPSDKRAWGRTKRLMERLKEKEISFLNYSNLFNPNDKKFCVVGDGHPSPLAYQVIAKKLADDLRMDKP